MKSKNLTHLYKEWQSNAKPEDLAFVDEVFEMCERNYEAGGDVIVECYGPNDILQEFKSLADVRRMVDLNNSRGLDARWGEDSDAELKRPKPDWEK